MQNDGRKPNNKPMLKPNKIPIKMPKIEHRSIVQKPRYAVTYDGISP